MTRRSGTTAALLISLVGIAAWARPDMTVPNADPSLALGTRTPVPPGVLSTLRQACFDCHSNETRWPLYSNVPIASWLIAIDVKNGRGQMNFSQWGHYSAFDRADMLDKACDMISKREMPLWQYRLLHSEARLTRNQITALCAWAHGEADRLVQGGS
jgi:hypothetical protein